MSFSSCSIYHVPSLLTSGDLEPSLITSHHFEYHGEPVYLLSPFGHIISISVPYNFDAITRTPNTLDAHRLIRWALPVGKQA